MNFQQLQGLGMSQHKFWSQHSPTLRAEVSVPQVSACHVVLMLGVWLVFFSFWKDLFHIDNVIMMSFCRCFSLLMKLYFVGWTCHDRFKSFQNRFQLAHLPCGHAAAAKDFRFPKPFVKGSMGCVTGTRGG